MKIPWCRLTSDGFQNAYGQFVFVDKYINFNYFPAYYLETGSAL